MSSTRFAPTSAPELEQVLPLLQQLESLGAPTAAALKKMLRQHAAATKQTVTKDQLLRAYLHYAGSAGLSPQRQEILSALQLKPVRTISGVTPITVLTKPFPCPGQCIFCPNDIRMPKSYLADEPGAQRAERNYFDPYLQTYNRLLALQNIGHSISKAELLILGGTWSFYPEPYQIWFVKECFRALNEFGHVDGRAEVLARYQQMATQYHAAAAHSPTDSPAQNEAALADKAIHGDELQKTYNQVISEVYVAPERKAGFDAYQTSTWEELAAEQHKNEAADCRSVGLVVETRPDNISEAEVLRIRRLGATKTQIGVQSLQDKVLQLNRRGHDVAATRRAFGLLRRAGFKIHAHWMPNLYGSTPQQDKDEYLQLFSDPDFCPDELKIYPCSLIESAELMQYYQRGEWQPYSYEELLDVLTFCLKHTPAYCRLTRVIRDIPSTDIVVGNKLTNFRQLAEEKVAAAGEQSQDIRARELRHHQFDPQTMAVSVLEYPTSVSRELFIQATAQTLPTPEQPATTKLIGFTRLSLPTQTSFIDELAGAAVIRELHVYGQALDVGKQSLGKAQHIGLGKTLLAAAAEQARQAGFRKLAVISAVGTREYYRQRGFSDGQLYQFRNLA